MLHRRSHGPRDGHVRKFSADRGHCENITVLRYERLRILQRQVGDNILPVYKTCYGNAFGIRIILKTITVFAYKFVKGLTRNRLINPGLSDSTVQTYNCGCLREEHLASGLEQGIILERILSEAAEQVITLL